MSISRILLVNPPHTQKKGLYPRIVFEPLGLAYVAAFLEKAGFEVRVLDAIGEGYDRFCDLDAQRQLVGLPYEEIAERIRVFSPDVLGIGVPFTMRSESALKVAEVAKEINPEMVTVLGGIHATSAPQACLSHPAVDYVVLGEGELPALELLKRLSEGRIGDVASVNGIAYKVDGRIVLNPRAEPVDNLDDLPIPARHLLPMDRYFQASRAFMTGRHGQRFACVVTSRGCPFKCTFCESYRVMGRKWRYRSPGSVVDEVEKLVADYRVGHIHFEDDNMTFNRDRIEGICREIIRRRIKIHWDTPNGVRADTIADEEVLRTMKKSGCRHICVAPESGSQRVVRDVIHKNMDLAKVERTVSLCKKVGIKVDAFFVIGLVGETKAEIGETVAFARRLRRLGASRCHFHIATPFEGTEIYDQAVAKGYLVDAPEGCFKLEAPRIQTPEFTVADVDRFMIEGCRVNSIIPTDKIGLVGHLLVRDPKRLVKASYNYVAHRMGGLSS
jgi:anaerobic magnesium-protoporphyrin IX monomethyl ester cyclase